MAKRYIDAEPVIVALRIMEKKNKEQANGDPFKAAYAGVVAGIANAIDKLPAADVVEVVRCKDCKYQNKGQNECEVWNMCEYRSWLHFPVNDEDYCSKGERRNE